MDDHAREAERESRRKSKWCTITIRAWIDDNEDDPLDRLCGWITDVLLDDEEVGYFDISQKVEGD